MTKKQIDRLKTQNKYLREEVRTLYNTVVAVTGKVNWALPPSLDPACADDWTE